MQAAQAKQYWTTNHNQSGRVMREGHEHRWELARYILDTYQPTSIFEFGCGAGRNLAVLRQLDSSVVLTGIDGNPVSVERGQEAHTNSNIAIVKGDEDTLVDMRDGHWDVVFTVSVLDHIPDPEWRAVYNNLKRIARKAMVLLEPIQPSDDLDLRKVHAIEYDYSQDADLAITNFTWAHDYFGHDPNLKFIRRLPIYLGGNWQRFGDMYVLMECRL